MPPAFRSRGRPWWSSFASASRLDYDGAELTALVKHLGGDDPIARARAVRMLLGRGTVALPVLRRVHNELGDSELAERIQRCIRLLEGEGTTVLPAAAARLLAQRKPAGAVEALLAYLPSAENPAVIEEVARALAELAFPNSQPHPALLAALEDAAPLRRAVAGSALCCKEHPQPRPAVPKLLRDPNRLVRLRVGLALAEVDEVESIPVLIDLLAEVPPPQHKPIEDLLRGLAGEWAPTAPQGDDEIARRIRRAAWAGWWRHTDGPALLTLLRRHTLSPAAQDKILALIAQLGDDAFETRQRASSELTDFGVLAVPLLRQATQSADAERARRAEDSLLQIADKGGKPLPASTWRLLVLRKPAGAVQALLNYLPSADSEETRDEVSRTLAALAVSDGRLDPALLKALEDRLPVRRLAAAEAILAAGILDQREAVRKLLRDAEPQVRLGTALALAVRCDRAAIPVLIEALAEEPSDRTDKAMAMLDQLAGAGGPKIEPAKDVAGRRKQRDAWAAWWKLSESTTDLKVLESHQRLLGYTLLVEYVRDWGVGRVLEVGRDGKPRWVISDLRYPVDAHVLPGNRVLIAEYKGRRITERDFQGNILWQKEGLAGEPVNCQRLPNGNTFIATETELLEVDRAGKTVWSQPARGKVEGRLQVP